MSNQNPSVCSKPLPRRLWSRRPALAPLIAAPLLQPLLRRELQLPVHVRAGHLAVYEVAETAAHAPLARIEAAAGLAEVGDGRQLAVDGPRGVPATVERVAGRLRGVLVLEADVDVAYKICSHGKVVSKAVLRGKLSSEAGSMRG